MIYFLFNIFSDNNLGGNVDNRKFMNEGVQSSGYEYPEAAKTSNEEQVPGKGSSSGRNSPTSSNRQNLV